MSKVKEKIPAHPKCTAVHVYLSLFVGRFLQQLYQCGQDDTGNIGGGRVPTHTVVGLLFGMRNHVIREINLIENDNRCDRLCVCLCFLFSFFFFFRIEPSNLRQELTSCHGLLSGQSYPWVCLLTVDPFSVVCSHHGQFTLQSIFAKLTHITAQWPNCDPGSPCTEWAIRSFVSFVWNSLGSLYGFVAATKALISETSHT